MLALGVLAAATLGYTVDTCPSDSYCIQAAIESAPLSLLAVQPNGQYMAVTYGTILYMRNTIDQTTYGNQPPTFGLLTDSTSVVFTPDNQKLFLATSLGVLSWNSLPSSKFVLMDSESSQTLAVSADSTLLATGPTLGRSPEVVKIYNTDTLAEVASVLMSEGGVITELTFSPDGAYLAYCNAGEGVVVVIRTADWTRAFEYQLVGVNTVRFSADSRAVLATSVFIRAVVTWTAVTWRLGSGTVAQVLLQLTDVTSFAWSPDARRIAYESGTTVTVHQFDIVTDPIVITTDHAAGVMMFRRDTLLQTCAKESGHCKIWSIPAAPTSIPTPSPTSVPTASPTAIPTSVPTTIPTASPTASPTAIPTPQATDIPSVPPTELPSVQPTNIPSVPPTVEPSAETTNAPPSVCVQPSTLTGTCASTLQCALQIRHSEPVRSVAFSPDSTTLATGSVDGRVRLFTASGTFLRYAGCVDFVAHDIAFSPDSTRFAVGGDAGNLVVCDSATGEALLHLAVHSSMPVTRVSFSEDGAWVISAGSDSAVSKYSAIVAGEPDLVLQGYTRDAVFSAGGARIATVGTHVADPVVVWDADNGAQKEVLELTLGDVRTLSFNSNATQLARGYPDGKVRVWSDGADRLTLALPSGLLSDAAFSPDDEHIAAVGLQDVLVWDAASGAVVANLVAHTSVVNRLAFSSDSSRLATAGHDGIVYVWNL